MRTDATRLRTIRGGLMRCWLVLTAIAAMFTAVGCGHSRDQRTATPAPALESFIFSSEDGSTTRFWLADPARPSVRRLLHTVEHQPGWAGVAAVSPDGKSVTYTVLPT